MKNKIKAFKLISQNLQKIMVIAIFLITFLQQRLEIFNLNDSCILQCLKFLDYISP